MRVIDLVRHGTTGRAGHLDGRTDPPLTAAGWAEFERQTEHRAYSAVIASPRLRAAEPAARLATARGLPLLRDPRWAEFDFGAFDGARLADLAADPATRGAIEAFYRDPHTDPLAGAERWADFEARIGAALAHCLTLDGEDPLLVVTHAGPMRMAISLACGLPFDRMWVLRIATGTRVRLSLGRDSDGNLWGDIAELVQP